MPPLTPATAQKLLAGDGKENDQFGYSVAVDGSTAVVGNVCDASGSAYVFVQAADGSWTQQAELLAADGVAGDQFGISVAISGDTAVIGARFDDNQAGSAYVFVRAADGSWTQKAKLLAADRAVDDRFGGSVSLSRDTAIIGADHDDDQGSNSGSVYVFVRAADGSWTQQAKLLASDGAANDWFGTSVALSDDTAVIGAKWDDDHGSDSGSAYVFIRDADGSWTQQTKLIAPDGAPGDRFGWSVAASGNTAVIGACEDDDKDMNSGSAYVFIRDADGIWTQQTKLTALDGAAVDWFGISVAVFGDTAVIGAHGNDDMGINSGSAYVFIRDTNGIWTQQTKLIAPDGAAFDYFGMSVAVSRGTSVIGAYLSQQQSGSAYVFSDAITVDAGGTCTLADAITAANTDSAAGGCPVGTGHDIIFLETDAALAAPLPEIKSPITLEGKGHVINGGNGNWSVLTVSNGGALALNEAAITGAASAFFGGGIDNSGTLFVRNSTISGNKGEYGGGIFNIGAAVVINSTVNGNSGLYGGGIFSYAGSLSMTHVTVSGNKASLLGGGIYNDGSFILRSSLVSGNKAVSDGNEVYSGGTIITDSYNLFGHSRETSAQAFSGFTPGAKDVTATSDGSKPTALAAILKPLAINDGPTKTHALVAGSPAIDLDAACSTGLSTDQRGTARPATGCDAGSFEGSTANHVNMVPIYKLLLLR